MYHLLITIYAYFNFIPLVVTNYYQLGQWNLINSVGEPEHHNYTNDYLSNMMAFPFAIFSISLYIYISIYIYIYTNLPKVTHMMYCVHHVPYCMSYHEATVRLVITGRAYCLSFWLHIYSNFCTIFEHSVISYIIYVYIYKVCSVTSEPSF